MLLGGGQWPALTQLIVDQIDLGMTPTLPLQLHPDRLPLPFSKQLAASPGPLGPVTGPAAELIRPQKTPRTRTGGALGGVGRSLRRDGHDGAG